jgi:hypothetical protein
MRRLCFVAAIAVAIVGQLLAQKVFALATDAKGNKPLSELNYTEWKGIVPIVNDKARVYQIWVNGNESFFYKGTNKELNVALAKFAKVEVKNHVVVLRPGPADRRSFDKTLIPFNWELHVIGGIAKTRATDDIEDLEWQKDPVLTIYIGGDIDFDEMEIPEGVTLRAAPGISEEAKKNEAARKRIEEFVEQRKNGADASANVSIDESTVEAGRAIFEGKTERTHDLVVRIDGKEKPIEWRTGGHNGTFHVIVEVSDKIPLGGGKTGHGFVMTTTKATGKVVANVHCGEELAGTFTIRRKADLVTKGGVLTFADIELKDGKKLSVSFLIERKSK